MLPREGEIQVLVPAQVAFAVRCPHCGKMEIASVSLFSFGGSGSLRLLCSCGAHKLTVAVKKRQVRLQVPCYLCEGLHFRYFTPAQFWSTEVQQLTCSETDLQLGLFGPEAEVVRIHGSGQSELEQLLAEGAFEDYFDNPAVMYETLKHVHMIASQGNLSCVCSGRKIEVDIFPDRLELGCTECGLHRPVLAATEEDLGLLRRLRRIEVGEEAPGRRQEHKP
jgi:hypothetical protein